MAYKILIEININPADEAVESYGGDMECLIENEIETVLEKLRYSLDGFDIRQSGEYETWERTKVKIIVSQG